MLKEDLKEGIVLMDSYDRECKILAVVGEVYIISRGDDFEMVADMYTFEELEDCGYNLKGEVEELTVSEICEELGREIKIKKD